MTPDWQWEDQRSGSAGHHECTLGFHSAEFGVEKGRDSILIWKEFSDCPAKSYGGHGGSRALSREGFVGSR